MLPQLCITLTAEMLTPDHTELNVDFFVSALGSKEAALAYLERMMNTLDPLYLRKKRPINDVSNTEQSNRENICLEFGDYVFQKVNFLNFLSLKKKK
jgi:hypothetical protein